MDEQYWNKYNVQTNMPLFWGGVDEANLSGQANNNGKNTEIAFSLFELLTLGKGKLVTKGIEDSSKLVTGGVTSLKNTGSYILKGSKTAKNTKAAVKELEDVAASGKEISGLKAISLISKAKDTVASTFNFVKGKTGWIVKPIGAVAGIAGRTVKTAVTNPVKSTIAVTGVTSTASVVKEILTNSTEQEQWNIVFGTDGLLDTAVQNGDVEAIFNLKNSIMNNPDFNMLAGDTARELATVDFQIQQALTAANKSRIDNGLSAYTPKNANEYIYTEEQLDNIASEYGVKNPITNEFYINAGSGNTSIPDIVRGVADSSDAISNALSSVPVVGGLLGFGYNATVGGVVDLLEVGGDIGAATIGRLGGTKDYFSYIKNSQNNLAVLNGGVFNPDNNQVTLGNTGFESIKNGDGTYTLVNKEDYNKGFQDYLNIQKSDFNIFTDNTSVEQSRKMATLKDAYSKSSYFKNANFTTRIISETSYLQELDKDFMKRIGFDSAENYGNVTRVTEADGDKLIANTAFGKYKEGQPVYVFGKDENQDAVVNKYVDEFNKANANGESEAYAISYGLAPTETKSADEVLSAAERQAKAAYKIQMREYYNNWGITANEEEIDAASSKLMTYGFTEEKFKEWASVESGKIKPKVEGKYPPAWNEYFDAGLTPRDKYTPYLEIAAEVFNQPVESIRITDKVFKNLFKADKDGNVIVTNPYEWGQNLKQSNGYSGTKEDLSNMSELATVLANRIRL